MFIKVKTICALLIIAILLTFMNSFFTWQSNKRLTQIENQIAHIKDMEVASSSGTNQKQATNAVGFYVVVYSAQGNKQIGGLYETIAQARQYQQSYVEQAMTQGWSCNLSNDTNSNIVTLYYGRKVYGQPQHTAEVAILQKE